MASSLAIDRLEYDFNNPDDGPNVGAFLRSADGTQLTSTTAASKEALDVNIAASDITLTVDLDVDLLVADDDPDTEDPLKVGSRGHDGSSVLGALSADGDKANQISDLYRRVWTTTAPNVGFSSAAVTVGATEVQLDSSKQAGRQYITVQNNANNSIWVGPTGVTTASGIEIAKGSTASFDMGEALDLYAIAAGAGNDVRVMQAG